MTFNCMNTITGYRIEPMNDYKIGNNSFNAETPRIPSKYELANRNGGKHDNIFG